MTHAVQQLQGKVESLQTTVQLTLDVQLENQEVLAVLAHGHVGTGRLLITLYDNVGQR